MLSGAARPRCKPPHKLTAKGGVDYDDAVRCRLVDMGIWESSGKLTRYRDGLVETSHAKNVTSFHASNSSKYSVSIRVSILVRFGCVSLSLQPSRTTHKNLGDKSLT